MTHWSGFDATADRRLLKKLADGGETALAGVYDIYAERLYDYALLFTDDVHIARDLVHDALIDAARRAPRMRDRRHLRPWLYGAVRRRGLARRRDTWTPPTGQSGDLAVAYAALAALDRGSRDALCLTYRHDLEGADLAATLGVSQRRARRRVGRATARAEQEALRAYGADPPAEPPAAIELVRLIPAAAPPEALRDRVLHTAMDPQLARYRKQIVARGGRLIASGLPRQPDAPSQVARRYAVGGIAMVAFLGVVTVGLNIVDADRGPAIGRPTPSWTTAPGHVTPGPSENVPRRPGGGDQAAYPTGRAHRGEDARDGTAPDGSPRPSGRRPGPRPSGDDPVPPVEITPSAPPPLPGQGTLTVRPSEIRFRSSDTAVLTLTAEDGAVSWSAGSRTSAVSLSARSGTIGRGHTQRVTVRLARNGLLQLPGSSSVTVRGGGGTHTVPVSWSISVLAK